MKPVHQIKQSCFFRRLVFNISLHMDYFYNLFITIWENVSFGGIDFQ